MTGKLLPVSAAHMLELWTSARQQACRLQVDGRPVCVCVCQQSGSNRAVVQGLFWCGQQLRKLLFCLGRLERCCC